MKFLRKTYLALVLIILLAFFLRFWRAGNYPPLLWDEASLGYNAFSIFKTGKDEYGKVLPLIFKSFGDYKPGLYVYLATPFVSLFGLNELAVRLPSIILGSLSPLLLYLLVKQLFKDKRLALFSAAALAFLPWSIHFSRGAWEANVMVFFLLLGSYFWFKEYLSLSLFSFLLALFTYQGAKMIVPLLLLTLFWLNFSFLEKKIKPMFKEKKKLIAPFLIALLAFGWYWQSFSGEAKNRLQVMSLFSYQRPEAEINQILAEDNSSEENFHFYLFHGQWLHFLRGGLTRYFNHFSPRFLAFDGDWNNPRHSAPYFGMVGHINFVIFLFGLAFFLSKKKEKKQQFFLYWLLIAPLPAALTRDIASGVRSLTMVVPLAFFIAQGAYWLVSITRRLRLKKIVFLGLALFFFLDLVYWADLYFNHMVKKSPEQWLYGYRQTVEYIKENQSQFDQVLMTDFYGQPYIFYLFYTNYDPEAYQVKAGLAVNQGADVGKVEKLGKISFCSLNWSDKENHPNSLLIFSRDEVRRSEMDKGAELSSKLTPLGEKEEAIFYANENH